jgi:hypothetical protein
MSAVAVSRRFIFKDFEHLRECGKSGNTKLLIGRLFRKAAGLRLLHLRWHSMGE